MILIFVASLNENMKLANTIKTDFDKQNVDSKIINLVNLNLPMYDTLKEQNDGIPQVALDLAKEMEKANAYVIVSPEYNYGVPPVLVNTIAWISRIGDDFRALFTLKTIQLVTHSGSGGQDLLNSLRSQFTRLGSIVMPREIIATYVNHVKEDSLEKILNQFTNLVKG
jgi:chromate reductase, NAD(P)H dehydrogenase (quinone)